jgi:hypothetical protein
MRFRFQFLIIFILRSPHIFLYHPTLLMAFSALVEAMEKVGALLRLHISAKRTRIVALTDDDNLLAFASLDTVMMRLPPPYHASVMFGYAVM